LSASRFAHARRLALWLASILSLAAAAGAWTPVYGHGFGQRYELPLPLGLYLFGAAAVVALSFVVFGLFVRGSAPTRTGKRKDLLSGPVGRIVGHRLLRLGLRLAVLALFVLTVFAGFLGDQNPYRNIAPTMVWIIFWVGLAYVSAFAGDVWALVNPWRTVFDAAQWLSRRLGGRELRAALDYPPVMGVWPACLLLLGFAWIELVYPNAGSPFHIAALTTAYSVLTWTGMLAFGRDTWLGNGEVFSLVFGSFARFAPTQTTADGRLLLRPFGLGLTGCAAVSVSMMAFVLLLLSTVLYDGLIGTGEWELLEGAIRSQFPAVGSAAVSTAGLVAFWVVFLGAYLGICSIMSRIGDGAPATLDLARAFALTLVPIAIGYHVAHYLVFLVVQGQYIIPLLSDPFGRGWNLLGTAGYRVDIALAGARFSWYLALAAIVGGHLIAVYLAHRRALALFEPARVATATQVPLTVLMVVYTFVGLSIMAEPIVETRSAAEPVAAENIPIPADAILPVPLTGKLERVGPNRYARSKLTYKVLGSAFHDGTKTGAADLLYAYAFVYRWGTPANGARADYDPHVDAASTVLRRHLAGVRVAGVDAASKSFRVGDINFVREVLMVEVYLSSATGDLDGSALLAPPWSTLPWPLLVLMEEAVSRGWAVFSQAEALRRNVPWLDIVRSAETNARLAVLMANFEREAFRPPPLVSLVTAAEARERWRALAAFFKTSGHLLVTNGPYKLKSWTPRSVTLEAFRDLTYPLGVGSYDAYAIPRRGFITDINWNGERLAVTADIEVVEKFQRSYRLVRSPLKSAPVAVAARSAFELRYVLSGAHGQVVLAGTALPGADARFEVNLKDRLPPGTYALGALVAVNGNVMNAEIRRLEIIISGAR
jgi:hypothetical protein